MCGILAYWCRESVPHIDIYNYFLKSGIDRGSDAFGLCVIAKSQKHYIRFYEKTNNIENIESIIDKSYEWLKIGDIIIANYRAAPETEPEADGDFSIQPIIYDNYVLSHNGSVSNFIYKELSGKYSKKTTLDSEAIIWSYIDHGKNIKGMMEYLSGGFAYILFDKEIDKLIVSCTHNPLYCGYVVGEGMFWSSEKSVIWDTVSNLKYINITDHNMAVFEDYYVRSVPSGVAEVIDLQTGLINKVQFEPRYVTPKFDTYTSNKKKRKRVLVAASSGLDSTTTLAALKMGGYSPEAVYFNYGHRGGKCEEIGIDFITKKLDIPLHKFDISDTIKSLDSGGMLTDSSVEITTGTDNGLKTTAAWTCWRNGFFVSYIAALAEKLIMSDGDEEIYITGGFMNLTESGVYPDNSERFIESFIQFNKYASICGTRIKPLYGLCNLLKSEQYFILNKMVDLKTISPYMISCDRPKLINNKPHNCSKNGMPACGSGLLSYWASKYAGVDDYRNYYEVDEEYEAYKPKSNFKVKTMDINSIVHKIRFHSKEQDQLKASLWGYVIPGIDIL